MEFNDVLRPREIPGLGQFPSLQPFCLKDRTCATVAEKPLVTQTPT